MTHRHPGRERVWLEELFDRHGQQLRAFAIRRVGPDNADDVVSEAFEITWRRRLEVPEPALPWLYQTTRNVVLHHHRSRFRQSALTDAVAAGLRERSAASAEEQSRSIVDSILDGLDLIDAEVLRLTVWEQLTPAEIAVVLQLSPGATRNRLMRARRHAQKLYESSLGRVVAVSHPSAVEPCPTLS